jgi:hypothetical protein
MRAPATIVIALSTAVITVACRQPSGPVEIPPGDIPFAVARSEPSPSPIAEGTDVTGYLVLDGRLHPVTREILGFLPPEEAAMQAVLGGPTTAERAQGIGTKIPFQTSLLQVRVVDSVAEVDLSAEYQGPASPNDIVIRVAQVVWTLALLPDVTAVRFSIDGSRINVVTDRGPPVDRPVTALDYSEVAPHGPA